MRPGNEGRGCRLLGPEGHPPPPDTCLNETPVGLTLSLEM